MEPKIPRTVLVLLLFLLIGACSSGPSGDTGPVTRTVSLAGDGDYESIQECITSRENGDTCLVKAGTYHERIDFQGKAINVISASGPEVTIIDGGGIGPVVTFRNGEPATAVLEGFTVTNGYASGELGTLEDGGGIVMMAASPTIRNCVLLENEAVRDGGGIYCFATGSRPRIQDVVFLDNTAGREGGALCALYGSPLVENTLFAGNRAETGGAMSARFRGTPTLTACTLADNTADAAAALYLKQVDLDVTDSILWGNASGDGHPVVLALDADQEGSSALSLSHVDLQGGTAEIGRSGDCPTHPSRCTVAVDTLINTDPLFVPLETDPLLAEPDDAYYLSQKATGRGDQTTDSPCVDAGDLPAAELGLDDRTTRTDGVPDEGIVDLGFHPAAPEEAGT